MDSEVFYAATKILAASVTGGQGNGMHKSPVLVADAVDLAEQLVAEMGKRADARDLADQPKTKPTAPNAPVIVPPPPAS